MMPITIEVVESPEPGLVDRLPWNYVPAALSAFGQAEPAARHVFAVRRDAEGREVAGTMIVEAAILQDPVQMAQFLTDHAGALGIGLPFSRCFLGPPVVHRETVNADGLPFAENLDNQIDPVDRIAVVIDGGIAFWDPALRVNGTSLFREIAFLDFDARFSGNSLDQRLDRARIAQFCALADMQGTRAVIERLAEFAPGSFFASDATADPTRGWHGTAVADLVAGGAGEAAGTVALYGVELPLAVLQDHDGDSLSAVLSLTLEMVLAATASRKDLPLVIVLPFGFVAGPQDGTHPVAQAIDQILTIGDRNVTLVVPAGNQRQDRCSAVIDPDGLDAPVVWRIPPDDFSPSAVDIVLDGAPAGGAARDLYLTTPEGTPLGVSLRPGDLALIRRGDLVVGALLRRQDTATSARMRLVLAGTGRDGSARPRPPAGDWQIGVRAGERARLYALRDDRDRVADQGRPHRSAVLVDRAYRDSDRAGAPVMGDDGAGQVVRAGTASVLTTAARVTAVRADERLGSGAPRPAWYAGLPATGVEFAKGELVDDGWPLRGIDCAANGSGQRARLSGTSAAAALRGRRMLGLPERKPG
jgi:hypothetical protein